MRKYFKLVILLFVTKGAFGQNDDKLAIKLADKYYERYLETFPEERYYQDIPLERHDQISSNDLKDVEKWEFFEDSIYNLVKKITETRLKEINSKIAYWLLKEKLESSIEIRVCKRNLWDVNQLSGWQISWADIANYQPVGSDEFKKQAFERWNKLPFIISTEIQNLKLGVSRGYTMPKEIVQLVIDQLQIFLDYEIEKSPFYIPATKDSTDNNFKEGWKTLLVDKILPAIASYQKYLKNEYMASARTNISILANPNGAECYKAFIRNRTTTNKTGEEIFELGQSLVANNKKTVEKLGGELYNTTKFSEVIKHVKADSTNYFKTSEEIMSFNTVSLDEAKKACRKWFNLLPSTEVTIKPYESYESGTGAYEAATENKPAYYRINLRDPEKQKRSDNEKLTFHEAYPGHHVQLGIQKDLKGLHRISKILWFGSYVEGWARYSEQLAEEMNLYKTKTALIIRRAWPARGMVVDPGIHLKNWAKSQALDFMKESGISDQDALSYYHRVIVWPAQLTSYDVGGEEIKELRKLCQERLGKSFDIKDFHTKILENGSIPLGSLRVLVMDWLKNK
ncbi:DUF885 domain-containing protein [Flavobacterium sp.]|uniref:DUF885 domain-containing protein n=1 Tax=Flavobacterium sp. TaxID=239 RepID=UPI0025C4E349|nr:DUF885 domain-containing protein [Flavobacterium sp.]